MHMKRTRQGKSSLSLILKYISVLSSATSFRVFHFVLCVTVCCTISLWERSGPLSWSEKKGQAPFRIGIFSWRCEVLKKPMNAVYFNVWAT